MVETLTINISEKEVCFYKAIGWTDGNTLNVNAIKGDMNGMAAAIKLDFDNKVDECSSWSSSNTRKEHLKEMIFLNVV